MHQPIRHAPTHPRTHAPTHPTDAHVMHAPNCHRVCDLAQAAAWDVDPDSDEGYWWAQAAECTREKSRSMVRQCAVGLVLGVDPSMKGVNAASKKSVYNFAKKTKIAFPRHLLVFRQGDFYEAYGHDAVMLVEHAGLNPMGSGPVAKAGCPVVNLRSVAATHFSCMR